ncbi:MAG: glycosyltransferase family 4 protein [Bacteroidales bacterium]|nr:glycosyltransferase family 4 protein [Bacteroidales bacterium]
MDKKLKVIFCGNVNEAESKSWGKTNTFFLNELQRQAEVVGIIDYSIKNRIFKKIHKVYCRLFIGQYSFREPLINFLMEKNFIRQYKKTGIRPDLFIHSSGMVVPRALEFEGMHALYTDASISGGMKFNNLAYTPKYLFYFFKYFRIYAARMRYIFTFNEWTRQNLLQEFKVEENKVINIGFGANLLPYNVAKDYNNGLILTVLRRGLEKNKGLLLLLEAFKIARKKNKKLRLAVVGTTLEAIEGVEYYEGFPREKTIELFRQASLFALPALFEPNGMVYIEALASRTPVLGLNRLAFPEFCGQGKYGYIVESNPEKIAQTMVSALNDPDTLRLMGESGQQYVIKRFSWDIVVKTILNKSTIK